MEKFYKCQLCGAKDEDVILAYQHIGGKGDCEPVTECRDSVSCWRRWDEQNGITVKIKEPVPA